LAWEASAASLSGWTLPRYSSSVRSVPSPLMVRASLR